MLFPFYGYLGDGFEPATSTVAAARARRIREDAARYQPSRVLGEAESRGSLRRVPSASLLRYRVVTRSGRVVEGLVGEVAVGALSPHEATRDTPVTPPPAVEIRPILVVTRAPMPAVAPSGAAAAVVVGGSRHEAVPVVTRGPELAGAALVIADGHHRVRAVLHHHGEDARILALVIGGAGHGLTVGTFHRVFEDAGPLPPDVEDAFRVEATTLAGASRRGLVWVQGSGERFLLTPRRDALDGLSPAVRRSGAAVAASVLYPRVGLDESRARYVTTVRAAVAGMRPSDAALLLAPASMETVLAAAESGTRLPPKSSRFTPKPVRGLVLRVAHTA